MKALFSKLEGKKVAVFDNEYALDIFYKACEAEKDEIEWFKYAQETENKSSHDMYMRFSHEAAAKARVCIDILNDVFGMNLSRVHCDEYLFEII